LQLHKQYLIRNVGYTKSYNIPTWRSGTLIHKGGKNTTGKRIAITGWLFIEWDKCEVFLDTPELRAELLLQGEQIL